MKTINTIATTEKGALKNAVRTTIVADVVANLNGLTELGFEYNAEKKTWSMSYQDTNGKVVYATLTLVVGLKAPSEKANRKGGAKKTADTEIIVIE